MPDQPSPDFESDHAEQPPTDTPLTPISELEAIQTQFRKNNSTFKSCAWLIRTLAKSAQFDPDALNLVLTDIETIQAENQELLDKLRQS